MQPVCDLWHAENRLPDERANFIPNVKDCLKENEPSDLLAGQHQAAALRLADSG